MKNVTINKEDFCTLIKSIQEFWEQLNSFNDEMSKYSTGWSTFNFAENLVDNLISYIAKCLDDPYQKELYGTELDWWLGTNPDNREIYIDDKTIDVSTPELFYDYLINYRN